MQVNTYHLSVEERDRRISNRLCMYCGLPGHQRNNYLLTTFVETIDGRPLGSGSITRKLVMAAGLLHKERIQFYILPTSHTPLILGLPWLRLHNPQISWREGQVVKWSTHCQQNCLSLVKPIPVCFVSLSPARESILDLPEEYADLTEAFSKEQANTLPPHRKYDCAIDLLPGHSPPKGRIFPLSQPESEAMKDYINEELQKGFIRPSTSPASSGFFFLKKKDGGLCPCIDLSWTK